MQIKSIKTILHHPLARKDKLGALLRFFKRGLLIRLHPYPMVYPFIDNTKLLVEKNMASAELQIYTGMYDFSEMFFLLHFLKEEDLFIDVGANVGVYTVLVSGVKNARCISIEPIPTTFQHLIENININYINNKVKALNIGVGEKNETLMFTKNLDSVNHVQLYEDNQEDLISIPINSLDDLLQNEKSTVLKIDVEGYETKVILGATETLKKATLKAIIIELNGLAKRYDFNEEWIHQTLQANGFSPYYYDPFNKELISLDSYNDKNTIYIRDLDFVKDRIKGSQKYRVLGEEI